jgi:hypothetical protein
MVVSGDKKAACKDYIVGLDMLASMRLCANAPGQHGESRRHLAATRALMIWWQ